MEDTILAVGASGKFAGLLVPALARRGREDPRHDPADARAVQAAGALDVMVGALGLRGNALTLAATLGREPRTLRAHFEELVADAKSGDGQ